MNEVLFEENPVEILIDYDMESTVIGDDGLILKRNDFSEKKNAVKNLNVGHVCFAFVNVYAVPDDANFWNIGVRANSYNSDAVEDMKSSIRKGWDTTSTLPLFDRDTGKCLDGRTRIHAMRDLGYKYMPVEIVKTDTTSVRNTVATGVRTNTNHKPSNSATKKDFIAGGFSAYKAGELSYDKDDILLFIEEAGFSNRFGGNTQESNIRTEIVNGIIKEIKIYESQNSKSRDEILIPKSKAINEKFVQENISSDLRGVTIAVNGDYLGDAARIFHSHVVPHFENIEKEGPLNIVLYTTKNRTAQDYDARFRAYMKMMLKVWGQCYAIADKKEALHEAMSNPPFRFLGVVPQVLGRPSHMRPDEHELKTDSIVPMEHALGRSDLFD